MKAFPALLLLLFVAAKGECATATFIPFSGGLPFSQTPTSIPTNVTDHSEWISEGGSGIYNVGATYQGKLGLGTGGLGVGSQYGIVWLKVNGDVSVAGAVRANEVRVVVPNGQYPDYVFSSAYKLLSLPAVELAIKNDGHLPGIPSAKEIESSGLAVSTMMVKQMEKIEELTLYAIQLDKTNKDLQKRLEALEARLGASKE